MDVIQVEQGCECLVMRSFCEEMIWKCLVMSQWMRVRD